MARFPNGKDPGRAEPQPIPTHCAPRSTTRCRSSGSACSGCWQQRPAAHARRSGRACGRGRDGRRQRAPRTSTCASCTRARSRCASGCRSTTSSPSPCSARPPDRAASCTPRQRRLVRERRVRRRRDAAAALGRHRRLADRGAVRPTTSPAARSSRWRRRAASIAAALELADPDARELLERAAVADIDAEPFVEACNLIAAAVRRELARRVRITDPEAMRADREARRSLESPGRPEHSPGRRRGVARVAPAAQ